MISRLLFTRWAAGAVLAIAASLGGLAWNAQRANEPPGDGELSCCAVAEPAAEPSVARTTDGRPTSAVDGR